MAKDSLEKARLEINEIDKEMAELFLRRMKAVEAVAEYKKANDLPIFDEKREAEVISRNSMLIEDENMRGYYQKFLQSNMEISKA
jgi:chorismate mutase/prephenate dehydratase